MRRRGFHIILIAVLALLSIGEAYHYHPDGGKRWQFVAFPFTASLPTTNTSDPNGHSASSSLDTCLLHFWSSLLSTISILLLSLLLPPVRKSSRYERTPNSIPAWIGLSVSTRGPPPILS